MLDQKSHIENSLLNSFKAFIGSHFLLNCINSIQSDVILNNQKSAFDLLQRFNRLYKSALRASNNQFNPIQDEIDFLQNYLALEHIRFPSHNAPRIKTDIRNEDLSIPSFVFQSLIENAWLLALETTKSKMAVTIKSNDEELVCDISIQPQPDSHIHDKVKSKTELALYRLDLLKNNDLIDYNITWNSKTFQTISIKLN